MCQSFYSILFALLAALILDNVLFVSGSDIVESCSSSLSGDITSTQSCTGYGGATELIASGMRRKSLFVVELDIYKVEVYMHPTAAKSLQRPITSDEVVARLSTGDPLLIDTAHLAIALIFARAVGTSKIVDAIVEALSDIKDKTALKTFETYLISSLGPNGGATGDKIAFIFVGEDILHIEVRGKPVGTITSAELRIGLIGIYLGTRTRVPLLRDAFIKYFN